MADGKDLLGEYVCFTADPLTRSYFRDAPAQLDAYEAGNWMVEEKVRVYHEWKHLVFCYACLSFSRPLRYSMVVFDTQFRLLYLPAKSDEHYHALAAKLSMKTLLEYFTFELLTFREYGCYEKKVAPVRVHFSKKTGTIEPVEETETFPLETYWWQQWGGVVSRFTLDREQRRRQKDVVSILVGDYKRLPLGIMR